MDIKWIEDLLSVAQTRSFSRSADERGITQSALSKRIRALEQWVGTDLVDRSSFPMALTPAGMLFCGAGSDAMKALADARAVLQRRQREGGAVRIAAGHTLACTFVPRWLQSLEAAAGKVRSHIAAANVHDTVLALADGQCDVMLCYDHAELPVLLDRGQLDVLAVGQDELLPVSAPARSGAPAFALPGALHAPLPWLAYGDATYFGRAVALLVNRSGPAALAPAATSDMAEVLKALALAGRGLAWLPASCIERELAEGRLVRAGGAGWSLPLQILAVRRQGSEAAQALWDAQRAQ